LLKHLQAVRDLLLHCTSCSRSVQVHCLKQVLDSLKQERPWRNPVWRETTDEK